MEARSISVSRGGKKLITNISLELLSGEVLVIIGPNGAGKSTFVKTLAGELKPDSGLIQINQCPLQSWDPVELARFRGMLPQSSSLAFNFTVFEVVLMGRSPFRNICSREENERIAAEALNLTEMALHRNQRYNTLSGGERQRVQFSRVLAQIWEPSQWPRFLLMDEPTSALDLAYQHLVLALVRQLAKQQNIGVLTVLHDLNLAALYADRIAVLEKGSLIKVDGPEKVLTCDMIETVFHYSVLVKNHPVYAERPLVIACASR